MLRKKASCASYEDHLVDETLKYLKCHVYSDISLSSICKEMNYSKSFLCPLFKQNTGYGIMEWYRKQKIEEACRLLRKSNHSIHQISDLLHYNNPQHFSRTFRQVMNVSPRGYREGISSL